MAGDGIATAKPLHLPAGLRDLPTTWSWLRLDDACEGVFDCPHSTPKLASSGPLVVRSQDMITGTFRAEQAAHVSEDTYLERTTKAIPSRGDLLYSREGTYFGIAAEVPEHTHVCLGQRMVLIRPHADSLDFRFLRHWLNSPVIASHIHGYRDGSVAERLNLPTIRALPVAVPPLREQRAIAGVLGTLDDKIELNRRMNDTLEAMARALFKSWFIEFDPVRAKAEGRDTGLPDSIADLFPGFFEDSELGEIPQGWPCVPYADTVEVLSGGTPKTSVLEYWHGGIPWYSVVDTPRDADIWVVDTEKKITEAGVANSATQVLLVGTTIISARGTVGKTALVGVPMALNQSCYGLRGRRGGRGFFNYFMTRTLVADLLQRAHGSVFDTITRDTLSSVSVVSPPGPVVEIFEQAVGPVLERMRQNIGESRTLVAARDALQPRLISGELRIPDAEHLIGREC